MKVQLGMSMGLGLLISAFSTLEARAGCDCNADVNNNGVVNVIDAADIADCARIDDCSGCVNSCDVNCDGDVDWSDFGAMWCEFEMQPGDCCNKPEGACTPGAPVFGGECIVTQQSACVNGTNGGTWHGDNTVCVNNEPVVVPAASSWGLLALTIAVLIGGTLLLGAGAPQNSATA